MYWYTVVHISHYLPCCQEYIFHSCYWRNLKYDCLSSRPGMKNDLIKWLSKIPAHIFIENFCLKWVSSAHKWLLREFWLAFLGKLASSVNEMFHSNYEFCIICWRNHWWKVTRVDENLGEVMRRFLKWCMDITKNSQKSENKLFDCKYSSVLRSSSNSFHDILLQFPVLLHFEVIFPMFIFEWYQFLQTDHEDEKRCAYMAKHAVGISDDKYI